ncbi:hypothetical protein [Salipiger abyssi]|uniref:hypothetical protein n=1 Tax=Salipiger abyssi TaxID=1250539 RepID=UPI00405A3C2B
MGNIVSRYFDRLRGSGEAAITLPPMDGALRPNNRIEEAALVASVEAPDNLVSHEGRVLFSSGAGLCALGSDGQVEDLAAASSPISFLASHVSGALAMGLEEGRIDIKGGAHNGKSFTALGQTQIMAPSAAVFADADTLLICLASQRNVLANWKHDLMTFGTSGSVWSLDLGSGEARCLAKGLAFPSGIALGAGDALFVSESWRHRVLRLTPDGKSTPVLDELPGYPSRLVAGPVEEIWMCVFAPRTQLIEFVLREKEYRERMIAEIEPEYWIAPSLHYPSSYLEPMQGGGLKQLGELKPWAPSRSIGLVVRLDAEAQPVESLHSRADGRRHGVTSCLADEAGLLIASKGGNAILRAEQ